MKKTILSLLMASVYFASCKKERFSPLMQEAKSCELQTINPSGRSYAKDSVVIYECQSNLCGLIPLGSGNFWVYQDSLFNDGVLVSVQYDTLRFTKSWKSEPDDLVWWEGSLMVGLPERFYANDSALFRMEERLFMPDLLDVKKDYSLFPGDSIRYLASFDDIAAQGRSLKLSAPLTTAAGTFSDLIYFEKNARNYRKDQVYFKPGLGVIKYIQEKAPMGTRELKLQQVSTLVRFSIE